jgi:iron(III) transport system substrate-binding protein
MDWNRSVARPALLALAFIAAATPAHAQPSSPNESVVLQKIIAAAKVEGSVMVYHTSDVATMSPALRAFESKYGIKVENYFATGAPLSTRFSNEGAAGNMRADVFYASDTTVFVEFANLFQQLTTDNLPAHGRLPDVARLKGGLAVSQAQFSFAFMYNSNRVRPADVPRTWTDLIDPKWKGRTLLVDPRSTATFRAALHMARQHVADLLPKIVANDPRLVETPTPAAQQLAAGTGAIAFLNYPSHAVPLMEKGAPIKWATIEGPEIARSAWMGATKGPHPNAGALFVNYLLSDEALALYCKRADGAKTILDPDGKRTGCNPIADNVLFLPDTPLAKADGEDVIRQLKLQ